MLRSLAYAVQAYADWHATYEALFGGLDDAGWHRREPWWKPWGYDVTLEMRDRVSGRVPRHPGTGRRLPN